MRELQVRAVLVGLAVFGAVDLAVHQRVTQRLDNGHLGPLGLTARLALEGVVVHNLLRRGKKTRGPRDLKL